MSDDSVSFEWVIAESDDDHEEILRPHIPHDYAIFVIDDPDMGILIAEEYDDAPWEPNDGVTYALGYEAAYGLGASEILLDQDFGVLDTVPITHTNAWYVVSGIEGFFTRGDGWSADDDSRYDYDDLYLATPEMIAAIHGFSWWDQQ